MKRNRNHSFGTQSPKKAEKEGLGQAQRQQCPALLLPETFPGRQRSLGDTAHSGIVHPGITRATQGVLQLRCHAILQPATDFSRLLFCPNSCFLPTDRISTRRSRRKLWKVRVPPYTVLHAHGAGSWPLCSQTHTQKQTHTDMHTITPCTWAEGIQDTGSKNQLTSEKESY